MKKGKVYLVGAGPGDPGLLTLRAMEVLSKAEAVLYDALVHPRILGLIPAGAQRIFRGSRGRKGSLGQKAINQMLVRLARSGKSVVRLKGGDPFVFGRGAEEGLVLRRAGIPFEVVPGVSAAVAVPAYAGIPVTHRELSSSFTVVTGHEDPSKGEPAIDWAQLAEVQGTLVFLMGLHSLPTVVSQLLRHGKDPLTPCAAIQSGTTFHQKSVLGRLKDLPRLVREAGLTPPATVVVGKVVDLAGELDWLSSRPLWGWKVLVTRGRNQSNQLTGSLLEKGAEVVEVPTLEIRPLPLTARTRATLRSLDGFQWLIFSSVNAVEQFMRGLAQAKAPLSSLDKARIACVGAATATALEGFGLRSHLVPRDYKQEGLVRSFRKVPLKGKKVLMVQAGQGRDLLEKALRKKGASLTPLVLYENRVPAGTSEKLREMFAQEAPHLLTFASSSAVDHFFAALPKALRRRAAAIPAGVIGPVTAASARKWGVRRLFEPRRSSIEDLVQAVVQWTRKHPRKGR